MPFRDFSIDAFLRENWQKKPLLIKNPWKAWANPLSPDELAGLACEEEVESRLITQQHGAWEVEHGAFPESRFGALGTDPWTLLVQAVDHYLPAVADLIEPFRFIPNWRIDDVMVSCASDGGGVGPHFDQYDVFLMQGLGQRRWQVGPQCDETSRLMEHDELRLLADFDATEEWVLDPGDILYVPPGVAHNGVAVGDNCMTYSIGFRAPSRSELTAHWADHVLAELTEDDRYADPDLQAQSNPGEIAPDAIAAMHGMVLDKLADRDAFARWYGQYSSTPKYAGLDWRPEEEVTPESLPQGGDEALMLVRNPASRFSFIHRDAETLLLFVDGLCFDCHDKSRVLAERLCAESSISIGEELRASDAAMHLVARLVNEGSLILDPGEADI